jgi:hypothetical protein
MVEIITKYILMGASSNLGNLFSTAGVGFFFRSSRRCLRSWCSTI